jgi:hypothetical protein
MKNQSRDGLTIGILIAVVILFGIVIYVLWRQDLFSFSEKTDSATVVAASIALIGTLFTAVLTLIGVLLKHSLDMRNIALQREAENRLKLDTAIRAVQLFGTNEGKPTPLIQRAGALFGLSSLGQHELTLELVSYLLKQGNEIDPEIAVELVDKALISGDEDLQNRALTILWEHNAKLVTPTTVCLPSCIMDGVCEFKSYLRSYIPRILSAMLLRHPIEKWQQQPLKAQGWAIIATLCLSYQTEINSDIKNDLAAVLQQLFKAFPDIGIIRHPKKMIDTSKLRNVQPKDEKISQATKEVVERLKEWQKKLE